MTRHVALLRPAVGYTLRALDTVTPELLARPTPCSKWNLQMLLRHTSASVATLQEGLGCGRIGLFPEEELADTAAANPAGATRVRLRRLLDDWISANDAQIIAVADHRIPLSLMTAAAALEIAVHGWDIYQASGQNRPIPAGLAADLLATALQLVTDENRHHLFAEPIPTAESAGPGEQLLAFLGRPSTAAASITTEAS
jgi:uncharacterized protein (TIGR03086 family)